MGRRPGDGSLEAAVEKAVREQLKATTNGSKDRHDAIMAAIKLMAVKAKIDEPDEGSGFNETDDKGEQE